MRIIVLGVLAGLALMPAFCRADSIDDAEAKSRGVPVEVVQLDHAKALIMELQSQLKSAHTDLTAANAKIASLEKQIDEQKKRADDAYSSLEKLQSELTPEQRKKVEEVKTTEEEIKAAIAAHDVVVGMSVSQVDQSLGCKGAITGGDSSGRQSYQWQVYVDRPYRVKGAPASFPIQHEFVLAFTISATVENGKIASYSKN